MVKAVEGLLALDPNCEIPKPQITTDLIAYNPEYQNKEVSDIEGAVGGILALNPDCEFSQVEIKTELDYFQQNSYKDPTPTFLNDHNYAQYEEFALTIDQQYADDIGWASTATHVLEDIENKVTIQLDKRNLKINQSKTEKYKITRNGDDSWKKCKYVGSLLGTEEDIERRKLQTNIAYCTLKQIFNSKQISESVKIRIFKALLESIFLYNSELWTLTKTLESKIDSFQRRLLRKILNIRWNPETNWLTNEELYQRTKQIE